jgi:hypothetical protein
MTLSTLFLLISTANAENQLRGLRRSSTTTAACRVGMTAEVVNTMQRSNNARYIGQRGTINNYSPFCSGCQSRGCYHVRFRYSGPPAGKFCYEHLLCGAINPPAPSPSHSNSAFKFGDAVQIVNTNDVRNSGLIGRRGRVQSNRQRCAGCSCYDVRLDPLMQTNIFNNRGSAPGPDFKKFCENDLRCVDSSGCGVGGSLPAPTIAGPPRSS